MKEQKTRKEQKSLVVKILGTMLLLSIGLFLFHVCVYKPLKFGYIVRRIESATTAEEERRAFELAARWGRLWEVDPVEAKDFPKPTQKLQGKRLIRIEWLDSRFRGGVYQAYRAVIDTNNLEILHRSDAN